MSHELIINQKYNLRISQNTGGEFVYSGKVKNPFFPHEFIRRSETGIESYMINDFTLENDQIVPTPDQTLGGQAYLPNNWSERTVKDGRTSITLEGFQNRLRKLAGAGL